MILANFICDNCKEVIATQKVLRGYQMIRPLHPMGQYEEWCDPCVMKFEKERSKKKKNKTKKIINMKSLQDIIAELQAVDTTALDVVVAAINQAVTDLGALPVSPVAPTVSSVSVAFTDGTSQVVGTGTATATA